MMGLWPFYQDWLDVGVRWLHVICAIAWIGSSFYFVHLDLSLRKSEKLPNGVSGEVWQVHGGGFYHVMKYMVAPAQLPEHLIWFKWEAYVTFLSGLVLLVVHYFLSADLLLIDKSICDLTAVQAIFIACGFLTLGFIAYEILCRSPLKNNDYLLLAAFFIFLVACAWILTHIFSGKGAFIILGALMGTAMAANVAMIIIPNQRKIVASLLKGEAPDPRLGAASKQRSLHNNYLTLAVLFLMLSNHYPLAFGTRYNWLICAFVLVISGIVRYFFNQRHAGFPSPWWTWGVAALCFAAIMFLSVQGGAGAYAIGDQTASPAPRFADVETIISGRCSMCHQQQPVWDGLAAAPRGVLLDSPENIHLHAMEIAKQAVWTTTMPPGGNVTELSPEERAILHQWIMAGAPEQ